jgi:hypothetical protein
MPKETFHPEEKIIHLVHNEWVRFLPRYARDIYGKSQVPIWKATLIRFEALIRHD